MFIHNIYVCDAYSCTFVVYLDIVIVRSAYNTYSSFKLFHL